MIMLFRTRSAEFRLGLLLVLTLAFSASAHAVENTANQDAVGDGAVGDSKANTAVDHPQTDATALTPSHEAGDGKGDVDDLAEPDLTKNQGKPSEPPSIELSLVDRIFGPLVDAMALVLMWEPLAVFPMPLVVIVLVLGSIFFTVYYGFLNFRGFRHAVDITRGLYDNPEDPGEISHFQALTSALSATVGLGNIAGVAVAVAAGGPGAVLWMALFGLFGMSAKLSECTLAQIYRHEDAEGGISGGPMYYLSMGLKERGLGALGKILAAVFAVFCILGSFGGGNMFQANQCFAAIKGQLPAIDTGLWKLMFGLALATAVGLVIIGGIKKIGQVTERIIPLMVGIYLLAGVVVLATHAAAVPGAIMDILTGAFVPQAAFGGFVGVLVQGIRRAAFSNEAGIGSAAIAHSAAKTDEPAREGMVAMLGPFIDTVLICSMTGILLVVTGAHTAPDAGTGVEMTRWAFADTISWFPWVLAVCIFLFAYSTMISWSYYGEKAWEYLLGRSERKTFVYRMLFLGFVVLGTVAQLETVITFSDLAVLSMAFPNIIGGVLLAPVVKKKLNAYWARYQAGEFKVFGA